MVNTQRLALWGGVVLSGFHFIRTLCIGAIPTYLQQFLDRIVGLHMIKQYIFITQFNFVNMLTLVIFTFIAGYIYGRIMGLILNDVMRKTK